MARTEARDLPYPLSYTKSFVDKNGKSKIENRQIMITLQHLKDTHTFWGLLNHLFLTTFRFFARTYPYFRGRNLYRAENTPPESHNCDL